MNNNRIGENIRFYRKQKGLTQKQLGDLCGLHDSAIRRYENGGPIPKDENLSKIADALGVSTFQLKMRGIEKTKEWKDATALDDFLQSIGVDVFYDVSDPDSENVTVTLQNNDVFVDISASDYDGFKRRLSAYAKHLIETFEKKEEN